jgi:hypothetical protein
MNLAKLAPIFGACRNILDSASSGHAATRQSRIGAAVFL